MMDDRELLHLAAKSVGIELVFDSIGNPRNSTNARPYVNVYSLPIWNPRKDDGDAFRLAMELRLKITPWQDYIEVQSRLPDYEKSTVNYNDDICSATRMAIFAVAAEIGRTMS